MEVLLYHHHDGYPEGVGFNLIQRQKKLKSWDGNILINQLVKDATDEYEIAYLIHTDLDYWYEIDCDRRTIRCWKVKGYTMSDHTEVVKGDEVTIEPPTALKKRNTKEDK